MHHRQDKDEDVELLHVCCRQKWLLALRKFHSVHIIRAREVFGHSFSVKIPVVTCWHHPVLLYSLEEFSIDSSRMMGKFPGALNFNRFLPNIAHYHPMLLDYFFIFQKQTWRPFLVDHKLWLRRSHFQTTASIPGGKIDSFKLHTNNQLDPTKKLPRQLLVMR